MSVVGSGLSAIGGIAGLLGAGSANNVQLPQSFQMPNMSSSAANAYGGIGGLSNYNLYGTNLGQAQQTGQNLYNNPFSGLYQRTSGGAATMGLNQATGQYTTGENISGLGTNVLPQYAGDVMQTAFDPQQALYTQTLQNTEQQQNAQNALSGVGTSPYGGGLMNQALQNFNTAWQQQQLQNQLQGLQGATGALQVGGQLAQGGQQMAAQAPLQYLQAGAMPYSTYSGIGQGQLGALTQTGQYGAAAGTQSNQQIQDYLNYLGVGNQSGQVANQTAQLGLQQNQQAWNQMLQSGAMLGGGLSGLSGLSGGSSYMPFGVSGL